MDHNTEKRLPKYAVIEQDFAEKIDSGELPGGSELPSESDLMELYQVSRVTARRAIDELYHHGYIEKCREGAPVSKAALPCRNSPPFTVTQKKSCGTA